MYFIAVDIQSDFVFIFYGAAGVLMKERAEKTKEITYHALSVSVLVASLVLSFVRFQPVFWRVLQALEDLIRSVCFYFAQLFEVGTVRTTVNEIPEGMEPFLPVDWEIFKAECKEFWNLFKDKTNVRLFFTWYGNGAGEIARVLILLMIPASLFVLICWLVYGTPNNDYNADTKPLKAFKRLALRVGLPVKTYVTGFFRFAKNAAAYRWIFCILWIYNLSFLTIQLEAVAYLFYFSIAIDFLSIWTQIVKLCIDLTVAIGFLPWWLWAIAGWKTFDSIRRKIGYARLEQYERRNRDFLNAHPGALFVVGKQRAKKTTIITDMALTQEDIFRSEAKKLIFECDKQFPNFPWINVELCYKKARERHLMPTLASCRDFLKKLRYHFERDRAEKYSQEVKNGVFRRLNKKHGYEYGDFIFGYDFERYGLFYNNGIRVINVFEAIENYVQLFYIYTAPTSLIFGNYPIRTDLTRDDLGNFPDIRQDFFKSDPADMEKDSRYSHPMDFNASRLGKVTDVNDPYKDGQEIGITTLMEFAKERGNQNTNAGLKAEDDECNVKNDGFELNTKMKGHDATIMYYTFDRKLYDDQRPDSLGADNRDLCDIIMIREVTSGKIVMPGFAWGELLYLIATNIYDKTYFAFRKKRGDNTLFIYLLKKLYNPIYRYYDRIKNLYTVQTARLKTWNEMTNETEQENGKYYVSHKKVYSNRFATDGIKDFYHQKALRSKVGLNDYPTFGDVRMTVKEMRGMNSRFYTQIDRIFRQGMHESLTKSSEKTKRKGK